VAEEDWTDGAALLEVLACQPRHEFSIDVVVTERGLVLLQAQAPQPSRNLHVRLRSGVSSPAQALFYRKLRGDALQSVMP
jgi:hypothetical protein